MSWPAPSEKRSPKLEPRKSIQVGKESKSEKPAATVVEGAVTEADDDDEEHDDDDDDS